MRCSSPARTDARAHSPACAAFADVNEPLFFSCCEPRLGMGQCSAPLYTPKKKVTFIPTRGELRGLPLAVPPPPSLPLCDSPIYAFLVSANTPVRPLLYIYFPVCSSHTDSSQSS